MAADSKLITFSFWIRRITTTGTQRIFSDPSTSQRLILDILGTGNVFRLFLRNNTPSTVGDIRTASGITDTTSWHHIMGSRSGSAAHLYLDDVSDINVVSNVDDIIDMEQADWGVGANPNNNTNRLSADLADLQIWFGTFVDLSVEANRRNFITADGKPVEPSVAAAAFGDPIVLLSGPTDTWHVNQGTGGGFTENGALTDGQTPVEL